VKAFPQRLKILLPQRLVVRMFSQKLYYGNSIDEYVSISTEVREDNFSTEKFPKCRK
jgi:hypothetical protein